MTSRFTSWSSWFRHVARRRLLRHERRRRQLRLESLESRTLLAADALASIAGTAFVDLTDNALTGDDVPLAGALVSLYRDGGDGTLDRGVGGGDDQVIGSQSTDASGQYRFDDLTAGLYFVEQPTVTGQLRRPGTSVHEIVVTEQDAAGVLGTPIDTYDVTSQTVQGFSTGPTSASSSVAASEALGGERDLFVEVTSGSGRIELLANAFSPGMLIYASDPNAIGRRVITWDGPDGDGQQLAPTGLGGIDLTEGGTNVAMRLVMGADQDDGIATLTIYTDAANYSQVAVPIPNTITGAAEVKLILYFSDLVAVSGTGADLTNVGAVQLEIAGVAAVDGEIDDLGMIGPTVLAADFPYLPPLAIGDQVWQDDNNNGIFDSGEAGIAGVGLTLYEDSDGNNEWTPGVDTLLANTTTDADGRYRFENLLPGDYLVQVDSTNFASGGPLAGLVSSTGNQPVPDPDDDVDHDNNGAPAEDGSVVTMAVTLTAGGEPLGDGENEPNGDGNGDPNTNLTVDFGFALISDLLVIKSDDPDPVVAGETLTYTLLVTNAGPSPVDEVLVTDTLPAGVAFDELTTTQGSGSHAEGIVSVELGRLESGGTATITIVVTVLPSTTGPLLNQATVSGDNLDPVSENNADDEPTEVVREIDLAIEKTDTPNPVIAGQTLTYTLTVTNQGPSDATGVTVEDTLPADVIYVSSTPSQGTAELIDGVLVAELGDLAADAQATITVVVTVDPSARDSLVNTAVVSGNETETNLENNEDQVTTAVNTLIDLAIDKTGTPDPVVAGETLTYVLTVTNQGPSDATGVTVVDTLPGGVSYVSGNASQGGVTVDEGVVTASLGDLPVGDEATVTLTVTVSPTARDVLVNEAVVSGNETETNLENNEDQVTTAVNTLIDLAIDKTTSTTLAVPGQPLTYVLTVTNDGPSAATAVEVVDALPAGVVYVSATSSQGSVSETAGSVTAELGALAPGAQATITIVTDVADSVSGTLVNPATVSGAETETNLDNNEDEVSTPVEPRVDLVIFKADSPDPVTAGEQLTYTLSVSNNGPSPATGVTVVDTLPAGVSYQSSSASQGTVSQSGNTVTANVGSLASGGSATVTIVVTVNPDTRGTLTNEATVSGNETDTNPGNNSDDEPTQIATEVDLAIDKTGSPAAVVAGGQLTYTLIVTNEGPSDATGVVVTDPLPEQLTFVSGTSTSGTVSHAGGVVTATLGDLDAGQSATITLVTQVSGQFAGEIVNEATVEGNEPETDTDNNTASEPTVINEALSLLAGSVYVDVNNNGLWDTGELPISGVTILLNGTDAQGAAVPQQTATTDDDGNFVFADLRRGTYRLTQQQPEGYRDGKDTVGSLAANTDVNDEFSNIQLPAATDAIDYLFGERTFTFSKRRFLSSVQQRLNAD